MNTKEFKNCPSCRQFVIDSNNISSYKVNQEIIELIPSIDQLGCKTQDDSISICCCPPDLNLENFIANFIPQLPKAKQFKDKPYFESQKLSFLAEKVLKISYSNQKDKFAAMADLDQKIYRENGNSEHLTFIVVKLNNSQIPDLVKRELAIYDMIMIQYGVPMLRDSTLNLIRIENAPIGFQVRDCKMLESKLNYYLGTFESGSDLAVRFYKNYNSWFVVIYLGSSDKMADVINFLKGKPFKYTSRQIIAQIISIEGENMNYLQFANFQENIERPYNFGEANDEISSFQD
eukprot:403349493